MNFIMQFGRVAIAAVTWSCLSLQLLPAQTGPLAERSEPIGISSGNHDNATPIEGVVWSQFVMLPFGTPWLRLHYSAANLDKGSYLRITSVLDAQTMLQHHEHVQQWNLSSCYFNGGGVLVELVAGPNTVGNFVDISHAMVGDPSLAASPDTICGSTDDRAPSTDARAGRIDPIGCTGWIINPAGSGANKVHLSAGHCNGTGQVLQFDVPASAANCALVFPPPAKQFAIDTASSQFVNGGIGNDYWVFRCFANSTTGLTTFQEQGSAFTMAAALPALNTSTRVTGFGLDGTNVNGAAGANGSCTCTPANGTGTRNQTQQTHTGLFAGPTGDRIDYQVDTCGGNSGSPVINNVSGQAMGIHTNGGCSTVAGSTNSGTSILKGTLQAAIAAVTPGVVSNDECAAALAVAVGTHGPFNTTGATSSSTAFSCGFNVGKDVWFSFTSCAGSHTFTTCTPTRTFDTVMQVFSGSCGSLTLAGCSDDTGGTCGLGSTLTLNLSAGTHFIRIGGYNQAVGLFDLVISRPEIYDAGPVVSDPTAGSGGAPASVLQGAAPYSMGTFGYTANATFSLADDFVTNGVWCVGAIELVAYQTTAAAPTITGVFVEIYNGDPSTTGVPIPGSPGFANNLISTAGYTVNNTLTGVYRVLDTALTDTSRQLQSVRIGLPTPLSLNSAALPGGRYFLRYRFTGSVASGPFVPPITVKNSPPTGNAIQFNGTTWAPILNGGGGQGLPFKLYGTSAALPGAFVNLGGGCSTATLEMRGAPHVGGVVHAEMVGTNPGAIPLMIVGFTNPNAPFAPFCGCVQHATLDVIQVGTSYNWQIPTIASGIGFELYMQGDQVFGPTLACDIGIGFRFELTDGYRIRLY